MSYSNRRSYPKKASGYSAAEKKAFYSGMGYRAGWSGVAIPFKSEANKNSFRSGYRKAAAAVSRYKKIK